MIERERIRRETEENQERLEKNKKQARVTYVILNLISEMNRSYGLEF
jgi:hypothetical protein